MILTEEKPKEVQMNPSMRKNNTDKYKFVVGDDGRKSYLQ